ncbi:hypothetical protein BYT27DRAFT_7202258 [Phlegmacium glaucopus]|nr:hypothetical protein BYT27DRAFT_7202258 [Phlegmacium glaucopus]
MGVGVVRSHRSTIHVTTAAVYRPISSNLDDESEVYAHSNCNLQIPVVPTQVVMHPEFTCKRHTRESTFIFYGFRRLLFYLPSLVAQQNLGVLLRR